MRVSERLTFGYFLYLAIVCWFRPLSPRRRVQVAGVAGALLVLIFAVANLGAPALRDWAPAVYILVGYFLPGRFFERPSHRFEAWLMDWDRRILGDPTTRFASWPRALVAYLDIVYMGCFVLVPGGFLSLALSGYAVEADRYWTLVAGSDFAAFLSLAWVQARPPWALERTPELASPSVHRAALVFVREGTIGATTFPSGHTAVSFGIAYALLPLQPAAGIVALALAATIAVGCIVGRYHYVIDVVTGAVLPLLVWAGVSFIRF